MGDVVTPAVAVTGRGPVEGEGGDIADIDRLDMAGPPDPVR
ncbi:hypothetical protein [Streptomyces clavuligerus]|nr:hypothetical protein [Streptomyces clavuligerus]